MEQLLLVGLWHTACQTAAKVLGLQVEFEVREEYDSTWASFGFSRGKRTWRSMGHDVCLIFYKDGTHRVWTDGTEYIDECGDPAPWKAATVAELIVALGDAPRGAIAEADWKVLEEAHRRFQGEVVAPVKAPKQLREGLRQIEYDARAAAIRAEEKRAGYYAGPAFECRS